jgi:hypothetical protein
VNETRGRRGSHAWDADRRNEIVVEAQMTDDERFGLIRSFMVYVLKPISPRNATHACPTAFPDRRVGEGRAASWGAGLAADGCRPGHLESGRRPAGRSDNGAVAKSADDIFGK